MRLHLFLVACLLCNNLFIEIDKTSPISDSAPSANRNLKDLRSLGQCSDGAFQEGPSLLELNMACQTGSVQRETQTFDGICIDWRC